MLTVKSMECYRVKTGTPYKVWCLMDGDFVVEVFPLKRDALYYMKKANEQR